MTTTGASDAGVGVGVSGAVLLCVHRYVYTCIHTYIGRWCGCSSDASVCAHVYICMYVCACICMYVCACVHMYVCMYAFFCVYVC